MSHKPKTPAPPALPPSHLQAMGAAGFVALSWQNVSIEVQSTDDKPCREWLPRHLVNWEKHQFIEYQEAGDNANNYATSGWSPSTGHTHGGHCSTVQNALAWFPWLEDQAGRRSCA